MGSCSASVIVVIVRLRKRRELDWRIGCVVYQIYVDRFAPCANLEAKKSLYPEERPKVRSTQTGLGGQLVESVGYYSRWAFGVGRAEVGNELAFWGGDLPSLTGKLDYINDLGVDVMYLQPVTKSFSNHKYDTTDYKDLDAQYGTDEDFKTLVDALHEKGMKLVLDFVFNHCGKRSNLVQEALKDKESPNRKFFFMGDEYQPHGYKVWGCAPSLVELALESKELQNYLWASKDGSCELASFDSALATWLRRGADGARLDVASEIGLDLLSSITRAAHRHKKGSLVVGEVWAYSPHWTSCMDAVLSLHLGVLIYGLAEGTLPGPSAAQSLARMVADSSIEEVLKCWIVVSNHDMPRLAHRLPDLKAAATCGHVRPRACGARKFAQALQFTWPGCPLIYYGDELGLEGGEDPHNRAPMPWGREKESEMLEHTKMLIALRKQHRALRIGDYRELFARDLMAFIRTTDRVSEVVIVLANPLATPVKEMVVVPVPAILGHTLFKDVMDGEETRLLGSTLTVEVKPKTVRIFTMVNEVGNPSGDQYKRQTLWKELPRHAEIPKGLQHKSMLVSVSDGDVIEPQKRCEECEDRPAAFACDYCLDNYCVQCFWKCHFNGHRRQHTASKVAVVPMCNQCQNVRATIFSEQTQELMCTECFTMLHAKGNRMLHLFMDAMDLLVLLERLDPAFQEHMRRARPRVLWALSQLQGWVKGIEARRNFKKRKDVVLMIQRRWRGVLTRRRLLGMLHMHKWRRRQVNNYFLPKTAAERRAVKQKTTAMLSAKDVTTRAANQSLRELRSTILNTATADPLEDAQMTRDQMEALPGATEVPGAAGFSHTMPSGVSPYTSYEQSSRFNGALTDPSFGQQAQDLSKKDIRTTRDNTLRQITRLD
ncbi:Cyclomaltodextrinase (Maltodextrin glucosidase) (TMG) [Durusdinium trenchii]|uniref:Cyclomaltodextrinase (Maltodextrin glucosidase) (TMG) n=1 Tax=Durusdinium trenchii TaxID=1381693 RepID=A0ABP0NIQ9_9DINO